VRRDTRIAVPWINIWRMLPESVWKAAHGEHAARARGHGADPVASAYLHLFPALYRTDLAARAQGDGSLLGFPTMSLQTVAIDGVEVNAPVEITDHAGNGIVAGDATLASAEAGKIFVDYIVERSAAIVRKLQAVRQNVKGTIGKP
jgi:creatinine amidohydrolase